MSRAAAMPAHAVPTHAPGLLSGASATAAGNIVHAAAQWALLVLLARLGGVAVLGQYALGLAVAGPVLLLTNLQLRAVQVTDAARTNHFSQFLTLRLITGAVALPIIAVAAWAVAGATSVAVVILLVGLVRTIESVAEIYRGRMQQVEHMDAAAASVILRDVAALLSLGTVLLLGGGLPAALGAVIVTDLVVWRGWDVRIVRRLRSAGAWDADAGRPPLTRAAIAGLARTALPLGAVAVLLSLNTYVPQYAMRAVGGDSGLGVYAAVLYAALASAMIVNAIGLAATPRLAALYEAGDAAAFSALCRRLRQAAAVVGALGVIAAVLIGAPFLRVVYGASYAAYADLFVVLCAVAAVSHVVSVQGYGVTAARLFRMQLVPAGLVSITTAACALLLVPLHGMYGAAAAMLAGLTVQGVAYALLLRRAVARIRTPARESTHAMA